MYRCRIIFEAIVRPLHADNDAMWLALERLGMTVADLLRHRDWRGAKCRQVAQLITDVRQRRWSLCCPSQIKEPPSL